MKFRPPTALFLTLVAPAIACGEEPVSQAEQNLADIPASVAPAWMETASSDNFVTPAGATASCDDPCLCDPFAPASNGCDFIDCGDDWCGDYGDLFKLPKNKTIHGELTGSVGGELRYRYLDEDNRLRPGGPGRSSYDQWRFTPFLELKYGKFVTAHVQAIDAATFDADLVELPIDENRSDLLQYYVDLGLWDTEGDPLRLRVGRQFLKYGGQRLVSPLGWSNTFRNFEGFRLYHESSDWVVDGFATQPVNGAAGNTYRPSSYDTPDQSVWFSGIYSTWKKAPHGSVDLYWLWLNEEEPNLARQDGRRHTIGARYAGNYPVKSDGATDLTLLWDVEGAWQFGTDSFMSGGADQDVNAGFFTVVGGTTFNAVPWKPTVKGLFWWGSGDSDPTDGEINTVSTLFPLGHAYWGLIDNFNGANLLDYSVQLSVQPHKKLTLLTAVHWFDKDETNDFIYNIAGAPLGPTGTPQQIGSELDLVATYAVHKDLQVQLGYFWFWYGDAVSTTGLARDDASQLYVMTTWKF